VGHMVVVVVWGGGGGGDLVDSAAEPPKAGEVSRLASPRSMMTTEPSGVVALPWPRRVSPRFKTLIWKCCTTCTFDPGLKADS